MCSETVIELFGQQAHRWPGRLAVAGSSGGLTYGELSTLTARVAAVLRGYGAAADTPVAVLAERGSLQLAGLLGVMRSGSAYVCLDTSHPQSRLLAQLSGSGAEIMIADRSLPGFGGMIMPLDDLPASTSERTDQTSVPAADDVAYISYTSGSTGIPKGVAVTHRGLANYSRYMVGLLDCANRPGAFATVTSLATDLGNTAVFPALVSGGCVHLIPADTARDPVSLADYSQAHGIDYMKITPSLLSALLEYPDPGMLPRKALVLGGESVPWQLVDSVHAISRCRVINHYGPTETTIGSLTYDLASATPGHRASQTVPIGRPIASTGIRIVGEGLQAVTKGAEGELLISGAGLARGYWRSPELTAESFITLDDGTRAYRTGDRVRELEDGTVEFRGRTDLQVKVRGYRVELGEIETVLRGHPQVAQAAVVAFPGSFDDTSIEAYVVNSGAARLMPRDLQDYLGRRLPAHMIPAAITFLGELPRGPSGKIDRQALSRRRDLHRLRRDVPPAHRDHQGPT